MLTKAFMCYSREKCASEDCKISLCHISSQDIFDLIVEGGQHHVDVIGALLPKIRCWSIMIGRPAR